MSVSCEFFLFDPIYQERVWGGRKLESILGRMLPKNMKIGESWDLVDREDANSIVSSGRYKGMTLAEVIAKDPEGIMGPEWRLGQRFPILIKWLDCAERLSLQVHPPQKIAEILNGESKTENWYIAHCEPKADIFVGFKEKITPEIFIKAIEEEKIDKYIQCIEAKIGDSFFIPSGRIHAIGAGNVILEIQENSDTTYRVHDWGRVGLDGKPRDMHIAQSLQSINFEDVVNADMLESNQVHSSDNTVLLAECPSFKIKKLVMSQGDKIRHDAFNEPIIISVVEGIIFCQMSQTIVKKGQTALLPYNKNFIFESLEDSVILITNRFVQNKFL